MVIPKREFLRTELYADWFRPQGFNGVMAAPALFKSKASVVLVTFGDRRREDFERADLQIGAFRLQPPPGAVEHSFAGQSS
jgi:hypothetical protein